MTAIIYVIVILILTVLRMFYEECFYTYMQYFHTFQQCFRCKKLKVLTYKNVLQFLDCGFGLRMRLRMQNADADADRI